MAGLPGRRAASAPASAGRHAVRPLVLAAAVYPQMEELALRARSTLFLAFRVFDPTLGLTSKTATGLGLKTWSDLLAHRAADGVAVRIVIADFDPLFATELHESTMESMAALGPLVERGALEAVAARHPGEMGGLWRAALWPGVRHEIVERGEEPKWWPPRRLWPASHHMKVIVADAREMIIGGLDVDRRRWDAPGHDRPAEETWHDVSVSVEGPAAADADNFFRWMWTEIARPQAREQGRPVSDLPPRAGAAPALPAPTAEPGDVTFQVTASLRSRSLLARGPDQVNATILYGLAEVIAAAREVLYVENQFLRAPIIGRRLLRALDQNPELRLIILTPAAPEGVVFAGKDGASARFGEWLQVRLVDRLVAAHGDRVGVFTPVGAQLPEDAARPDRARQGGRGIVYLHSKVMIAETSLAHVSSANLNGRSLWMDTEAGILWRDPVGVAAFRRLLWEKYLGTARANAADLADPLSIWREAAQASLDPRADGAPGQRCSVVPWDREASARFARYSWFIPKKYL